MTEILFSFLDEIGNLVNLLIKYIKINIVLNIHIPHIHPIINICNIGIPFIPSKI